MRWFLTVLGVIFGVAVFLFLDYALPSRQTVRITNTYNRLTEIGANAFFYASPDTGTVQNAQGQRDVRFIDTVRRTANPMSIATRIPAGSGRPISNMTARTCMRRRPT